jgi:hypothetical protein
MSESINKMIYVEIRTCQQGIKNLIKASDLGNHLFILSVELNHFIRGKLRR